MKSRWYFVILGVVCGVALTVATLVGNHDVPLPQQSASAQRPTQPPSLAIRDAGILVHDAQTVSVTRAPQQFSPYPDTPGPRADCARVCRQIFWACVQSTLTSYLVNPEDRNSMHHANGSALHADDWLDEAKTPCSGEERDCLRSCPGP